MWDGDPTTFTEYAEIAGHWEQSVAYHKRYLCGPKLQAELSGSARRFVMSMAPGWISFDGGVDRLLSHFGMHLGQLQLSEMSGYMVRCFKMSKRKRHEAMNEYITRKAELYMRACQSLDRVQQRYQPERSKHGSSSNTSYRPPSRPGLTKNVLNSLDGEEDFDETNARKNQQIEKKTIRGLNGIRHVLNGGNPRITQESGGLVHGKSSVAVTTRLRGPMARLWACFPVLFKDGFSFKMLAWTSVSTGSHRI